MDTQTTKTQVNPLYVFHKLNTQGQDKAKSLAGMFHSLTCSLHAVIFDGRHDTEQNWESREWAIVKTKLEEACFFAKKAMASQASNQEIEII